MEQESREREREKGWAPAGMRERVLKSRGGEEGRITAGHAGEKESEQIRRNERRKSLEGGEPGRFCGKRRAGWKRPGHWLTNLNNISQDARAAPRSRLENFSGWARLIVAPPGRGETEFSASRGGKLSHIPFTRQRFRRRRKTKRGETGMGTFWERGLWLVMGSSAYFESKFKSD